MDRNSSQGIVVISVTATS